MSIDYQRKKNNKYYLPKTLYRGVISVIKDYERMSSEADDILFGTPNKDIVSFGGIPGKPTEQAAIRLAQYTNELEAIEKALEQIPEEYRKAVFRNVAFGERFPAECTSYKTWLRWRKRFIYYCAQNLGLL